MKTNEVRIRWWPAVLAAVLVFCGFMVYRGVSNLSRVSTELMQIRQANERLAGENQVLYQEVQRLRSDAGAQARAVRRKMGLVRSDEVVYQEYGESPVRTPGKPVLSRTMPVSAGNAKP